MENELIQRIENSEFESCFLRTNKIVANNNAFVSNNLELNISISDEQIINENWIIKAHGVTSYNNLISASYMPFFTMNILTDHPLLWDFKYESIECELIGINFLEKNRFLELIISLSDCFKNQSGGFIRFDNNPLANQNLNLRDKIVFKSNKKILELIKPIFEEYQIQMNIIEIRTGEQKGWAYKPKAKVLLIRNPFVSSLKLTRGQAYIVADEFIIKRKNEA